MILVEISISYFYLDPSIKSVLSVPVVLPDNTCYCVIELYRNVDKKLFDVNDVKLIVVICGWMGATIHQNNKRVQLKKQEELNTSMIDITKGYISSQISFEKLLFDFVVSLLHLLLKLKPSCIYRVIPKCRPNS